jgi:hypothetical protein
MYAEGLLSSVLQTAETKKKKLAHDVKLMKNHKPLRN